MSIAPPPGRPAETPLSSYRCGTLAYTKAGIFTLFTWLLWGDFCFSLMEAVWPSVLPLTLKSFNAPNTAVALIMTTIPSAMNFVLNPIISTISDRYRSEKYGRRIPFLLFATPFITILLILMGFSREISQSLHGLLVARAPQLSPEMIGIMLVCLLIVLFRFFELFVNTIYWYLFNDVVPPALIGRFLGFFRVIGALAGALFNFFIFRYAESHTSWIFIGAALLYGVSFIFMCLNVKEGEYPPPDPMTSKRGNPVGYLKVFLKECFSHRIFRLIFLTNGLWMIGYCITPFNIFLAVSLGLSLDEFGKINGIGGLIGVLLMYPAGVLMDRIHPLRVMLLAAVALCLVTPLNLVFLWFQLSHSATFWLYSVTVGLSLPLLMIYPAASFPMVMRIFPHERFGQFCSANAMCGAAATIVGGMAGGIFLDLLKPTNPQPDFCYRYIAVWGTLFFVLALLALIATYREWQKLGGDHHYKPPIEDKFGELFAKNA